MGQIWASIQLMNGSDVTLAKKNLIGEEEVRITTVSMLVDTGAIMLCINENIQEHMQFPVHEKRKFQLADGRSADLDIVSNVELIFENRSTQCRAIVLPGNSEPLLGAIPMEELDVLIHPLRQELIINPAHPDGAVLRL